MSIVSETFTHVIGVDTHARSHTLALIDASNGSELDQATFPASAAGMRRAIGWIGKSQCHEVGSVLVVIEGIGSYGAQLARVLKDADHVVVEAPTIRDTSDRARGKSDNLDSTRIARSVLGEAIGLLLIPRSNEGERAALRILISARDQMVADQTRTKNALTALVRTVDLGVDARRALTMEQVRQIAAWRGRKETLATSIARAEAVRLATHFCTLKDQVVANRSSISELIERAAPELSAMAGVGPVVAANVLVAWSHQGRLRSEAAMASLAGTCPIPASSGNTVRHRLNRGGDRQLNRAIHTVALVRMRTDPRTREYVDRRTAEGRTKKEIMRSLKRYITRQIYRTLASKGLRQPRVDKARSIPF